MLTRPAAQVTVLDVVEAVEGTRSTFVCTEIRQRGPRPTPADACTTPCAIARAMAAADQAWREALRAVSVADLAADVNSGGGRDVMAEVGAWLAGRA